MNRSCMDYSIGWDLLKMMPKKDLTRIKPEFRDKYYGDESVELRGGKRSSPLESDEDAEKLKRAK